MRIPKLSKWLWLAIIADIGILIRSVSYAAIRVWDLLPYRSAMEWVFDPDARLVVDLFFSCAGLVGIVVTLKGDRRPLFFWNICHLAILLTIAFSSPMHIAMLFNRFGTSFEPALVMAASITATVAVATSS
jgi:hypothetical protein